MKDSIVNLLIQFGPMTCLQIMKHCSLKARSMRRYLYELRVENRIVAKTDYNDTGQWQHKYHIPVIIEIPKMSASEYLWWHCTGTAPEDIRRLVK